VFVSTDISGDQNISKSVVTTAIGTLFDTLSTAIEPLYDYDHA